MHAAVLIVVALLAGCAGPDVEPPALEAESPASLPAAADPAASPPVEPVEGTEPGPVDALAVFTHAQGRVALTLAVRLPDTTCDVGVFAHHGSERSDDPDYSFDLLRETEGGWATVLSAGSIPYPQGHASAGPADSRDVTGTAYDAAWEAYQLAVGQGETFTSGTWWRDVALSAGVHRLEAVGTHAADGGQDLTGGGSTLVGLDCADGFEVLGAGEDASLLFVTAMSADGETDVSAELGSLDVHQGSTDRASPEPCEFRFHANSPHGTVSLEGPVSFSLDLAATDDPTFSEDVLRRAVQIPPGAYTLAWDLVSAGNSYWDLGLACLVPLPAGQSLASWSVPA